MNGIQSQDDIVVLQFIDEHGDWVELVVLIRFHGGRSVSGDEEGGSGLATVLYGRSNRDVGADDVERGVGFGFPLATCELVTVGMVELKRRVVLTYLLLARKRRGARGSDGEAYGGGGGQCGIRWEKFLPSSVVFGACGRGRVLELLCIDHTEWAASLWLGVCRQAFGPLSRGKRNQQPTIFHLDMCISTPSFTAVC